MYLTTRKIRSAGRSSGSIEVTLPPELRSLEGIKCRLTVRDGSRPEIVLQPDLSAAQKLFRTLWQKLRLGLDDVAEIGDFSPADFTLALFPPRHWRERPPLAYVDALGVIHQRSASDGEEESESLTRLLACLGVGAAHRAGLTDALALAFGDAVAYLLIGRSTGLGTDFERGMAHRIFWGSGEAKRPLGSPFEDRVWRQAQDDLRRVHEQFSAWQDDPQAYAAARERWYRALSMEIGTQTSSVAEFIGP
jgi:hypothetical protein